MNEDNRDFTLIVFVIASCVVMIITLSFSALFRELLFVTAEQCPKQEHVKPDKKDENLEKDKFIKRMSLHYKTDNATMQDIVVTVEQNTKEGFPNRNVTLAIIAVESKFKPHVRNNKSIGLMQVNKMHFAKSDHVASITTNIKTGVRLLKQYRQQLKTDTKALIAYNMGPSRAKTISHTAYLDLIAKQLKLINRMDTFTEYNMGPSRAKTISHTAYLDLVAKQLKLINRMDT